jgi:hypothetical protein
MTTTTLRAEHPVTSSYTDMTATMPEARNIDGLVCNISGANIEMVRGGAGQPADTVRGTIIEPGQSDYCNSDHIWLKCRSGAQSLVCFVAL